MHAVEFIGMPEGQIVLAEATLYLACAAKSNSSVMPASAKRVDAVQKDEVVQVPSLSARRPLPRREKTRPRRRLPVQPRVPGAIAPATLRHRAGRFFHPTDHGYEAKIQARLAEWEKLRANAPKT